MSKLQEIREALEFCRFSLDPYDDVKPRDWSTDRQNLRFAHEDTKKAITTLDALMETHALVPISPNKKAFKILWNINNFNSIDECCTFYETLIAAAQEQK